MKNTLLSLLAIIAMASCQNKEDLSKVSEQPPMFVAPVYNNSDTAKAGDANQNTAKVIKKRAKRVVIKNEAPVAVHRDVIPEINTLPPIENSPVVTAPTTGSTGVNTAPASTGVGNNQGTEIASTVPQEKKKGWSKAAKGAVIGAGAGAIGGAIISKKKGLGAIIGGVVGAAGGYVIGKKMDKKDTQFVAANNELMK